MSLDTPQISMMSISRVCKGIEHLWSVQKCKTHRGKKRFLCVSGGQALDVHIALSVSLTMSVAQSISEFVGQVIPESAKCLMKRC